MAHELSQPWAICVAQRDRRPPRALPRRDPRASATAAHNQPRGLGRLREDHAAAAQPAPQVHAPPAVRRPVARRDGAVAAGLGAAAVLRPGANGAASRPAPAPRTARRGLISCRAHVVQVRAPGGWDQRRPHSSPARRMSARGVPASSKLSSYIQSQHASSGRWYVAYSTPVY